jgi:hypothetical protein
MMPTPRKYACAAERQAAYRRRLAEQTQAQSKTIAIPAVPGHRRWQAMRNQCLFILNAAVGEMQAYHDQRSEQWRDSERGEALTDMMESIAEIVAALQDLDPA